MSQPIYKPVADGVYQNKGSLISVGQGQSLAISKLQRRMNIWVGELPDGWKVCEVLIDPDALAVPVDDIERILREHDLTYGFKRESNLMVRRVQRWLDAQPKESEVSDGSQ